MVAWREILLEVNVPTDQSLWKKSGYGKTKTPEVVELQKWLNANGYNAGAEDGVYGKGTANAVRAFQKKSGLGVDGDAGPATLKAMQGAGNQPQAQPQAQTPAQTGVDGPADATAASKPSDASDPPEAAFGAGQQPASTTQTQPQATQTQPQATQTQPQAANTAATANDKDGTTKTTPAPATTQGADGPADATAQAGASDATAPPQQPAKSQTPVAAPKVSDEKFIQKGGDTTNFNVAKMKAKYPTPYVDIPQEDGTVIRGYGNPKDLEAYMQGDGKRTGAKIVGSTQQATNVPDTTSSPDKPAEPEDKPTTAKPKVEPQADAPAIDTPKPDTTPTDNKTASPDKKGGETFNVNGKEMTRNDINKRLNALLRKARAGQSVESGINFKSSLGRMLYEQLTSAEQKELQSIIDSVKDSRYYQLFLNKDRILKTLQDAGIKNIPGKPPKKDRTPRKKVTKYYKTDPETGKEIEIDKDEADAMAKRANVGPGDDDDFDSTYNRIKAKAQAMGGNTVRSSSSSSTSTVTRSGGSTSGGGSTTRFAKKMRDTKETKKLRAEKEKIEDKMAALGDKSDSFEFTQSPEYKKLKKELNSYLGMDGKIAKSREMVHPAGIVKNGKITYYNPKGGKPMKWDGEQYKPRNESIDNEHSRLVELAGIKTQPEIDYDIVDDAHVHMRNDKDFYRTKYFPSMCKMATLSKGSKSYDPKLIIMPLVNDGINSYCKKYNIAKMPDEVFKQDHRKALYDKIYSEEMKEIEKGEYA